MIGKINYFGHVAKKNCIVTFCVCDGRRKSSVFPPPDNQPYERKSALLNEKRGGSRLPPRHSCPPELLENGYDRCAVTSSGTDSAAGRVVADHTRLIGTKRTRTR